MNDLPIGWTWTALSPMKTELFATDSEWQIECPFPDERKRLRLCYPYDQVAEQRQAPRHIANYAVEFDWLVLFRARS